MSNPRQEGPSTGLVPPPSSLLLLLQRIFSQRTHQVLCWTQGWQKEQAVQMGRLFFSTAIPEATARCLPSTNSYWPNTSLTLW